MTGGVSGGVDGIQDIGAFTRTACPGCGPSLYISVVCQTEDGGVIERVATKTAPVDCTEVVLILTSSSAKALTLIFNPPDADVVNSAVLGLGSSLFTVPSPKYPSSNC